MAAEDGSNAENAEPNDVGAPETLTHPEEMKATAEVRFGDRFAAHATARATPAGMIGLGFAAAGIALLAYALLKAQRRD